LFLLPFAGLTQQHAAMPDTIFLDASWKITKHRDLAKFYRQISSKDVDSVIVVRDFYLSTGIKQMVGTYLYEMKPSNQNGRFHYYYPTGNLKAIYDYKWGIIHGELRRFYKSGILKSIEQFDMGTKVDTTWTFYENGQMHKVLVQNEEFSKENPSDKFTTQRLVSSFSMNGISEVEDGEGEYKDYFLSGKLKSTIQYQNGFPHGKWTKYTGHKKRISSIMVFKNGRFIKGEVYENGKKDVFSSLQRQAYFPSGIRGLEEYIDENIGSCSEGFNNEVIILVDVSTEGKVTLEQLLSGNVNACQLEEIHVLMSNMPLWVPAIHDGKYVEGSRSIKISFSK
jgi:antitoxin component YwqK of YwqJK toxin-antitoxin module